MKSMILLTGATGYIGGCLLKLLEAEGHPVRCLARRPEFLQGRIAAETELVAGDVLDVSLLRRAMTGVQAAYYLVHSMGAARGFEETDRLAAERFGAAARTQGVRRIIYLGGLGDPSVKLSPHLLSRQEVGMILRQSDEEDMKNCHPILMLALFVAICFAVAGAGAIATSTSVSQWYPALRKPSWNPPSWVFGPVWTVLYLMMAIAAWHVWRKRGFSGGAGALGIFALQLALNAAWSPLFFGLRNPLAGLVDIIPLWAAILATMVSFWRILPIAGALLMPYWLWVSFATALNFMIWRMNR